MSGVTISALIKKMNLELLTKEINTDKIKLYHPDVNRPALQMAGYYEHFDRERVQLIGVVEYTYMQRMTEEQRMENYEKLQDQINEIMILIRQPINMEEIWQLPKYGQ